MIKSLRSGRGGVLVKRSDEESDFFGDSDLVVDEMAPEVEETDRQPRRRIWTKLQFGLAALSATPLLFIGGLGGWPWDSESASATKILAGQEGFPSTVSLERLNINAATDPLVHDAKTNVLSVPAFGRAGWDVEGPEPGEKGRAVILARRSTDGVDPFAKLDSTRVGDRIVITTLEGSKLQFVVRSVERFKVGEIPVDRIYGGPQKEAQLRLISSAGEYKADKGGFQQNVAIFADLVT